MLSYLRIGRPLEAHEVKSAQDYRGWQAALIKHQKRERPSRPWRDPFVAQPLSRPEIRQGRWMLACACGNYPSYDPSWELACCPDCGAVYEGVKPPAEYQAIEAELMRRPRMVNRNYLPHETVHDLRVENVQHFAEMAWPG